MKTFKLSIVLSLAVAVYCLPVSKVTVKDEHFAEVCMIHLPFLFMSFYYIVLKCMWKPLLNCECCAVKSGSCRLYICCMCKNLTPFPLWQNYLKKFFNLTEETGPTVRRGISPVTKKLTEMQKFFGLKITGTLDEDTLTMMKKPRCGVPDGPVARFSTFGNNLKWEKDVITYRWVIWREAVLKGLTVWKACGRFKCNLRFSCPTGLRTTLLTWPWRRWMTP